MRNFCAKCGSPLDNNGKCPKCDVKPSKKELKAEKKSAKKQAKKDKKAQKKAQLTKKQKVKRFFLKFFAVLLALLIAVSGCLCALVYFDVLDIPVINRFMPYKNTEIAEGTVYVPEDNSVQLDQETGILYVNNIILIFFQEGTSENEITRIVSLVDGEIVGHLPVIDQCQVKIKSSSSLDELKAICETLKQEESVFEATYDTAFFINDDAMKVPNDPWGKKWYTKDEVWSEADPGGKNWWLEAIQAQSAWEYEKQFEKIKIGIVDNGFDTGHEDLKNVIQYVSPINNKEKHGTHVAGIIGAEANNEKGISGIVWNSDIVTWDWQLDTIQTISDFVFNLNWSTTNQILAGTVELVEMGAKVINLSAGQTASMDGTTISDIEINEQGYNTSLYLYALLSRGYDFVIVQSAGNGNAKKQSVDAIYNGLYCSITKDNCYVGKDISAEEIIGRIIVVGAAQNDGENKYTQTYWSNAGDRVDICAPGNDIYSTVPGGFWGKYEKLSGTSMSAPIVTGVASLVWSANSSLTGIEVKDIVCNPKNTVYAVDDNTSDKHPLTNSYRMVNADLSVQAAIDYISQNIDKTNDSVVISEEKLTDQLKQNTGKPILQFYYDDYDSDGRYEAFAVVGDADDSFMDDNWYSNAEVWFVSEDKTECIKSDIYGFPNGVLKGETYSFLSLEKSAGGSGSTSYVFGVKDGTPQEMNVSENYGDFNVGENYIFKGYVSDFSAGYHQWIYKDFLFDPTSFEFVENTPKNAEYIKNKGTVSTSSERDIVLVLDVSGSMNGTPLDETKEASQKFINTVLRQDASIGIVAYDNQANMVSNFNMNESYLTNVVSELNAGGGTNIEAGLSTANDMLKSSNAKKKIIVLMSDGEPNDGKVGDALIEYAKTIKDEGIYIYTLGFFESLGGGKSSAQLLMEGIASEGYHYEVDDADKLVFFFEDIADQLNGQQYIYIRIACPTDVIVEYDGETLCSADDDFNGRTSFGTLTLEDIEDSDEKIKTLRLKDGVDYDVKIEGTGRGKMDYTIGYMDESGEYNDFRKFRNIPITKKTVIDTTTKLSNKTVLNVDEDGDGKYDSKYSAEANGIGELVDYTYVYYIIIGSVAAIVMLTVTVIIIKKIKNKKRKVI